MLLVTVPCASKGSALTRYDCVWVRDFTSGILRADDSRCARVPYSFMSRKLACSRSECFRVPCPQVISVITHILCDADGGTHVNEPVNISKKLLGSTPETRRLRMAVCRCFRYLAVVDAQWVLIAGFLLLSHTTLASSFEKLYPVRLATTSLHNTYFSDLHIKSLWFFARIIWALLGTC